LIQIKPAGIDSYQQPAVVEADHASLASEVSECGEDGQLSDQLHPMTPHHLPFYLARPGETDWLMIVMGIFLIVAILGIGNLYLHLHSLPERMAHKSQKLQFEIVAVLGLLALFTHIHLFWIAALLLALVDLPDFGSPLGRIAGSVEKIADSTEASSAAEKTTDDTKPAEAAEAAEQIEPADAKDKGVAKREVRGHA
jgi:Sec-independent protein translocase protein TatA